MIKHDTNHIKTFRLNFSNPISFNEIPYLRGAIIKITKNKKYYFTIMIKTIHSGMIIH